MTDQALEERELTQFRQQYYGLLVSLLSREPSAALLTGLGNGIAARAEAAGALQPLLGEGWEELQRILPATTPDSAAEEFLRLFIGPFQPEVVPYESWYISGQLFQAPLIAVRKFLAQIGLERQEARYAEPEDVLAFELEVMNWLLTRQLGASSPEEGREWLHRQTAFLRQHLLIWAPACAGELAAAKSSSLYKGVAHLLRGLLAIERQRLQAGGLGEIETLEQARRRYGAPRAYQGPIFDPAAPPRDTPPSGDSG